MSKVVDLFASVIQTVENEMYLGLELYRKLIYNSHHLIDTEQPDFYIRII